MTTRRSIVLDALDRWHAEGQLDEATYLRLRSRAEEEAASGADETLSRAEPREGRSAFAMNALQLVGGLLLGAALVALVVFLDLARDASSWALLLLGLGPYAGAVAMRLLARRGNAAFVSREGLEEALWAAALVPIAASPMPAQERVVAWIALALAVGAYVTRQGRGPSVVLAGAAYAVAAVAAVPDPFGFGAEAANAGARYLLWTLFLAFGALLLVWRQETWTTVGLALYVIPLVGSLLPLLDLWGIHGDSQIQLAIGVYLGLLLVLGVALGNRGLVTGAAAGLTIDAVWFAAELGGPGTAVVVLLVLGGLLVWQAEFLRNYFRRRAA